MIKGGYAGKLLYVNLTDGTIDDKPLSEDIAAKFIGGYGIGARILYKTMKKGVDQRNRRVESQIGPDRPRR
jgi:aldehyde:ferredoxin oxidoreductase